MIYILNNDGFILNNKSYINTQLSKNISDSVMKNHKEAIKNNKKIRSFVLDNLEINSIPITKDKTLTYINELQINEKNKELSHIIKTKMNKNDFIEILLTEVSKKINANTTELFSLKDNVLKSEFLWKNDKNPKHSMNNSQISLPIYKNKSIWGILNVNLSEKKDFSLLLNYTSCSLSNYLILQEEKNNSSNGNKKLEEKINILEKDNSIMKKELERLKNSEELVKILNLELMSYHEKLSHKIKRIDESRIPLTPKEKLTFYGLIRYPYLNSKELSKKIDILPNTIISIRKRLKKENYITKEYIPRFDMLGCEILSVYHATFNTKKSKNSQNSYYQLSKLISSHPEIIYYIHTKSEIFLIIITKEWSDYKKVLDNIQFELQNQNIVFESQNTLNFPLDKLNFSSFFDYAPLIKNRFKLELDFPAPQEIKPSKPFLSRNEKKLIIGLMKYPEDTVQQLSEKLQISAPTICKIRSKVQETNIIKQSYVPNFKKLGITFMALTYHKLFENPKTIPNYQNTNNFLALRTQKEFIEMGLYFDYTKFQENINTCAICHSTSFQEKPANSLIPLNAVKYQKSDFYQLAKKILK